MTATTLVTPTPDEVCAAAARRVHAVATTAPAAPLTQAVDAAIASIACRNPAQLIRWADGNGGAHVFIESATLGGHYAQPITWVAFHVPHTLPDGDIYPLWLRPDLSRIDGGPIGKVNAAGHNFLHQGQTWLSEPAVMVSLRSSDRDPRVDSPARKLARVLDIVRSS